MCDPMVHTISSALGIPVLQGVVIRCVDEEQEAGQCARALAQGHCATRARSLLATCKVGRRRRKRAGRRGTRWGALRSSCAYSTPAYAP